MSWKLSDVQAGLRKGRGIRDQITNIGWIMEKSREFQKIIDFCLTDYTKVLTVWITTNCGKFLKRWEYQTTWPASWEICMQVNKQQSEPDMEKWTGSKLGKEYVHQGCILSPCLFNLYAEYIMWDAELDDSQGGIKDAGRNIYHLRYADDTTLTAESKEKLKSCWWRWKRSMKRLA